jgi:hypothetical protein
MQTVIAQKQCNKRYTTALGNMPKLPENTTEIVPRILCLIYNCTDRTNCIESIQYRLYLSASVSVPFFFPTVRNSKILTVQPLCWIVPFLDFCAYSTCCMACSIHKVRPAFNVVLPALIFVLVCSLGMRALGLQKWPLLKLENALSLLSLK